MISPIPKRRGVPFVNTSIAALVHETIQFVVEMNATAAMIGEPGIGKTASLQQISRRDPNAVLVAYRLRSRTAKGLHIAIMEAAGWPFHHKTGFEVEQACEECAAEMAGTGGYLLIDEYQNYDLEAIRSVLRFSDDFRLPIVFAGNEKRLRRVSADANTYKQIRNRIWKEVRLSDPTPDDFAAFAAAYGIKEGATRAAVVSLGLATSLRHVGQVLQVALEINGSDTSLGVDHLREAEAFLLSGTAQHAVLQSSSH